jgi:hypothetical protein
LGRTTADNDWHIFELIESAKQTFWKSDPPLTNRNIQAVISYLPVFLKPDFSAGEWINHEGHLPYINYSPEILNFIRALGENGFIQPFKWMQWVEGEQLVDHSSLLQKVGLQTLRKLLTAHIRADRFSEGHLAAMFESGHIVMILERMMEIYHSSTC